MNDRLTLDYGVRFVHQQAQYDTLGQASNFLPEKWTLAQAPLLYVPGCANGVAPVHRRRTARRWIRVTGQFLGPNSVLAIGDARARTPATRRTACSCPAKAVCRQGDRSDRRRSASAPRFGMAYDSRATSASSCAAASASSTIGRARRPFSARVNNPPTSQNVTVRYGQLQTLGSGGLTTAGRAGALGVQARHEAAVVDAVERRRADGAAVGHVARRGVRRPAQLQHVPGREHQRGRFRRGVPAGEPGSDARVEHDAGRDGRVQTTRCAPIRGYGSDHHAAGSAAGARTTRIQLSFQRRFQNGFSFGFNDTIGLYDRQQAARAAAAQRRRHAIAFRDDQAEADELLGNNNPQSHIMHGELRVGSAGSRAAAASR